MNFARSVGSMAVRTAAWGVIPAVACASFSPSFAVRADAPSVGPLLGKPVADTLLRSCRKMMSDRHLVPVLAVLQVGDAPAAEAFQKRIKASGKRAGVDIIVEKVPLASTSRNVTRKIEKWNKDRKVHGIMVLHPLPRHLDPYDVSAKISPVKDVEGQHPVNRLVTSKSYCRPCTAEACVELIHQSLENVEGKHAVVIGRSSRVGMPVALALLQENATVTVCHSKTENLDKLVSQADIVVACAGQPELVKGSWVKPGAVVIDVGYNMVQDADSGDSALVGDVQFDETIDHALVTPVRGGVGPVTTAVLIASTVRSAYGTSLSEIREEGS